jgi:preprotein translocase subunit SecB
VSEAQPNPQFMFNIEKIYVKDLSVEVPNAPQIFLEREAPQMEVNLGTESKAISEGVYETTLSCTVTAKVGDKTLFLVEVKEAGIFRVQNLPTDQMEAVLGIGCPNIVFPYLREVVSDVVVKAGFPPLLLNPVNFEALFMQKKQQIAAATPAPITH